MREHNPDIQGVLDNDLCIACGACVSACPYDFIEHNFHEYRGSNEVRFIETADCSGCPAPCTRVCPSIDINFAEINLQNRGTPERDGWIKQTYIGYSPEFQSDGKSSSGGILRALSHYALSTGTPVLTLMKSNDDTIEYRPKLVRTESDLKQMPGSVYHSTSFIGAIEILRESENACAIVGIPCQLAGIHNYITYIEPELSNKIKLTFGIVCGWMYSYHAHESFMSHKKLEIRPTDISYRGDDKVGLLKLSTGSGVLKFDRRNFGSKAEKLDYQSAYSTDSNRLRCRLCEDHTNLLADVIAGDAWLARTQGQKVSIIGVRSDKGQKVVDEMASKGLLLLEAGSIDDFVESQSENLIYGITAQKMKRWFGQRGIRTPAYHFADKGPEIETSAVDGFSFYLETLRRHVLRTGKYRTFWWLYLMKRLWIFTSRVPRLALAKLKRSLAR
ncbi:MAG: Coenzyme F420 hydrogenase/dehydrogenase, beta subunit C-terminal domain [Gammaproteobacteria bacterium]|nr:Coenzyme F420 hydrogenase/dehydrogenase, beta subunit C-terminal domain [Gammaproteobacteria bacterium]